MVSVEHKQTPPESPLSRAVYNTPPPTSPTPPPPPRLSMATPKPFRLIQSSYLLPRQASASFFPLPNLCPRRKQAILIRARPRLCVTVCVLMEDKKQSAAQRENPPAIIPDNVDPQISQRVAEKLARKRSERFTYLVAAVMSSFGITSMAVMAVYYRFYWQMEVAPFPFSLSLSLLNHSQYFRLSFSL